MLMAMRSGRATRERDAEKGPLNIQMNLHVVDTPYRPGDTFIMMIYLGCGDIVPKKQRFTQSILSGIMSYDTSMLSSSNTNSYTQTMIAMIY